MKFRTRLVVYYLIATLLSMFFVGVAVLKGIERINMDTAEQQLIGQSKLAETYISQVAFLENSSEGELSAETAKRIINNLSLSLGNVRLYDKNLNLLASSKSNSKSTIATDENTKALTNALKGNYAYIVHSNTIYFASPLDSQGKTFGLLEIIYPLGFLNNLMSRVTGILSAGAVVFAVLLTLLSVYIAGRTTKPVRKLATAANHYANRDFTPVKITGSDEIAQLGRSFNAMGEQLNDYIQMQKQFVANVSHELRTPLTAIKGYSQYLTDEVKGNPELQKAVYHLNNESERLTKLVDEILTLSRIDSGREAYAFERLNLSSLVEEVIEKMSVRAEKYGISILKEIKQDIYVLGDSAKLMQVLINLLDNAIKFSPAQTFLHLRLYKQENMANISIIDQGIGIPESESSKVFERFYRSENARGISGTGLGLSIVKDIVNAHKGTIELASGINGGTIANLRLPVLL